MTKPIPFGKYYLLDRINVGGMAEVFRAKAFGVEGFERIVAVKRILPSIAEDTEFITMFIDEAKIAVQLTHANIAQIFDLGKVGDSYFIALEYVHGKDLRALFDRAHRRGEALPVPVAAYAIMKMCEGLDYAHNKRDVHGRSLDLVHRDVSPQNVLISFDGEVKIIDFGIAKAAGKAGKTQAGILKGKFGYLSPEQVRGEPIDRRSDVFAMGICLWELLTGERLFGGDSDFSSLERVRNARVPDPRTHNSLIPEELSRIVRRALERDVGARYGSAMDLHDDLQAFLREQGFAFGRKELSAWMRLSFPGEVDDTGPIPPQAAEAGAVPSSEVARPSAAPEAPSFQTVESADVEFQTVTKQEDRDVAAANVSQPEAGAKQPKSTILGMPAMVGGGGGRTAPPPPPRGRSLPPAPPRSNTNPPAGARSIPAPPPSNAPGARSVPPAPPASNAPGARSVPPAPPASNAPGARSVPPAPPASNAPGARSVPPPPPGGSSLAAGPARSVPPPPQTSIPPAAPVPAGAMSAQAQQSARSPVLDMDWDDEELSTQIYDRPEDMSDLEDLNAGGVQGARQVPTYVPPLTQGGSDPVAGAAPAYDTPLHTPLASERPAMDTPSGYDEGAGLRTQRRPTNNALLAAVSMLAIALFGFGIYTFTSTAEPGVLQLATTPGDARVSFDGQPVQGTASPFLVASIEPGTPHELKVEKEGFATWSQQVQVTPGQRLEFSVSLEPAAGPAAAPGSFDPKKTGFSVESSPPGARVYLNGEVLGGVTPMRVTGLAPGSYQLQVELDGFKKGPATTVDVKGDQVSALPKFVLVGEPVNVTFESDPEGARVQLVRGGDTLTLGNTPLTRMVEPGVEPWTVRVSASGYETYSAPLELPTGQSEASFSANLDKKRERQRARRAPERRAPSRATKRSAPRRQAAAPSGTGTLRVNSKPWSQVIVDGRRVGNTPQMNIKLPAGRHKLLLVNPDQNLRKTVQVNISPGQTVTKIVTLD